MDDKVNISRPWFKDYRFHLVKSLTQFSKLIDICIQRKLCSLDLETTGINNKIYKDDFFNDGKKTPYGIRTVDKVVGLCISFDGENGYYIPLGHYPEDSGNLPWDESIKELTRLVNNTRCIFHNVKFDGEFLYPLTGKEYWKKEEHEDTFLLARVLSPVRATSPAGLKPLTKIHFGIDMIELNELFTPEQKKQLERDKQGLNFAVLHPKEGVEYGASDGIFTYKLWASLKEKLKENDPVIYDLEKSFCNIVRKMERERVHLDMEKVTSLHEECIQSIRETGDLVRNFVEEKTGKTGKWLTLNVGSPKQLSAAIFTDHEGLKLIPVDSEENVGEVDYENLTKTNEVMEEGTEQHSVADEALQALKKAYPNYKVTTKSGKSESVFDIILEYRHYEKMEGSYIGKFMLSHDKLGDVRPSFNQMGTDTARMSSRAGKIDQGYSGVNFQGIPRDSDEDKPDLFKRIRECIIPRPGWMMVKIDYSGEELRVVANMSGDPVWTKSFLYEDGDVHSITTRTLYEKDDISKSERYKGKKCNFAIIYGGGAGAISRNIGCSIEDGGRMMENLRNGIPVLMGYADSQKRFAKKHKCIYTAFGRRIPIPNVDHPVQGVRRKAERQAINFTIQSTSADIIKFALCFVDKNIRKNGWDDRIRYIMTVHDEVVYEVKPEFLMEIVPKLDEWMVLPWKLQKAHGREWRVPLETEPGIDINWKARYDFFHMVNGFEPNPKDKEDGKFVGKLKDDQYFHEGRIYQKVPDFLKPFIHRKDEGKTEESAPEPAPEPKAEAIPEDADLLPEKKIPDEKPEEKIAEVRDITIELKPKSSNGAAKSEPEKKEEPKPNGETFVWIIKANLTEYTLRKTHAVCVLTEGETPIKIIDPKGEILIDESQGIRVDPSKFKVLSEMFGLG